MILTTRWQRPFKCPLSSWPVVSWFPSTAPAPRIYRNRQQRLCPCVALSTHGTALYPKEFSIEEEFWRPIQVWRFESGFHVGHALNKSGWLFGFFFPKRALPAFPFVYKSTASPAAFILGLFRPTLSSPASKRLKASTLLISITRNHSFFCVFGFLGQ